MATFTITAAGGAKVGGAPFYQLIKATLSPPCGCCRNLLCSDLVSQWQIPFTIPETWTVTIPSTNKTCCAFNQEFTLYYRGDIVQEANTNQAGLINGCGLAWYGPNPCPGPNGNTPMTFVIQNFALGQGPGALYAALTIGCGFQSVAWENVNFQEDFSTLNHVIGTSSSCSTTFGGSWNERVLATPLSNSTLYQVSRHPILQSPVPTGNMTFFFTPFGGSMSLPFTCDSNGHFTGNGTNQSFGPITFSGNLNFATGLATISWTGNYGTGVGEIDMNISYSTTGDYPPSITMEPHGEIDCPGCSDTTTCKAFTLIATKPCAVAGGPTINHGRYVLLLGTGYQDIPAAGYTSVGCGACQWNYNHQSGQVGFMMTPGTLSYGINPTVQQMGVQDSQTAFDCLWTSYMEWEIPTDSGLPKCDCPTVLADGLYIVPGQVTTGSPNVVWHPNIGPGGALIGGEATNDLLRH